MVAVAYMCALRLLTINERATILRAPVLDRGTNRCQRARVSSRPRVLLPCPFDSMLIVACVMAVDATTWKALFEGTLTARCAQRNEGFLLIFLFTVGYIKAPSPIRCYL